MEGSKLETLTLNYRWQYAHKFLGGVNFWTGTTESIVIFVFSSITTTPSAMLKEVLTIIATDQTNLRQELSKLLSKPYMNYEAIDQDSLFLERVNWKYSLK
jgi:hypothetical protein